MFRGRNRLQMEIERYREIKRERVIQKARKRTQIKDQTIRLNFADSFSSNCQFTPAEYLKRSSGQKNEGTVLALNIQNAYHANSKTTITNVARVMASNSVDAVLVIDNNNELCGIVTDKDLLSSVLNFDPQTTAVEKIMTTNVKYTTSTDSIDGALMKMIQHKFRHLPVVDTDEQVIIGMLDIIQVLSHVQSIIANSWGKAKELIDAYANFKRSWQNVETPPTVDQWFAEWSRAMPTLSSLISHADGSLFDRKEYPKVQTGSTIREAVNIMLSLKSTAVVVTDSSNQLVGIFTSKDLLLRVVATNESMDICIIRVMTPYPDTADENIHVDEALNLLYRNQYQHIPVSSTTTARGFAYDGSIAIVSLVDVLTLTCYTLDQLVKQQTIARIYKSPHITSHLEMLSPALNYSSSTCNPLKQEERIEKNETYIESIVISLSILFLAGVFYRAT